MVFTTVVFLIGRTPVELLKLIHLEGKEEFFCYLKGIPGGMFFANGGLLCLSNHNKEMLLMLILTGILLRLPVG